MNSTTINTIGTILGMINPALGAIGNVVGMLSGAGSEAPSKFDKVAGQVKDAANVATSLVPLLQQFADGKEVTPDDVRAALHGSADALAKFEERIVAAEQSAQG